MGQMPSLLSISIVGFKENAENGKKRGVQDARISGCEDLMSRRMV